MNRQNAPAISVCIANYNGEAFIRECLDALLNQQNAPAFEIIVHDDASTDGSLIAIHEYPALNVIKSERNVGFCTSNNRMASAARGEYLLLLNNDAVLEPTALNVLFATAKASPNAPILSLPQYDYDSGELLDKGFLLDPFANPVPIRQLDHADCAMVMGSCLWIPRALWEQIQGFPECFESIGEDLYLCCYARILDHRVSVCSGSSYRHRVGESFGGGKARDNRLQTTVKRRALSERNKMFTLLIFLPFPLLLIVIPIHTALLLVEGIILSIWQRKSQLLTRIYVPAITSPISNWRMLRSLRIRAQRARTASWRKFFSPTIWFPWKICLWWRYGIPSIK